MKQDYTIAELQAEIAALQQLFDCVTLADPCRGLLDPATLQPLDKVAAVPALDANGRGMRIIKAASGLETVLAQGIRVEGTPCVLMMQMPLPRGLKADGDEDAFTRALSQMQEELRRETTQKRAEAAQRLAENRAALAEESERITRELEPQLSELALDLVNHLQHWQDDRHSAVDAETIAAPYADIEHLTAGEHTNATTNRTK